jgi:hypothetical protein
MTAHRLARLAVVSLLLILACARPASADVRQGEQGWEAPDRPSLDGRPPEIERTQYVDTMSVHYDDEAGTLTLTTRLYAPEKWGADLGSIRVGLGATCDYDQPATVTYSSGVEDDGGAPYDAPTASATLAIDGYDGVADGVVTFDGRTFATTYSHEALKGLDLRCVSPDGLESFYLDGYAPLKLTASAATKALKDRLRSQYGSIRSAYVKCANLWTDEDDGTRNAECMAHFRVGRRYHYLAITATVEREGYAIAFPSRPFHRTWTRTWRKAGPKCLRNAPFGRLRGVLYSNAFGCDARMASEIYHGVTGWHGTGTGSFLAITRYSCRKRARTYTCRNRVGDAFRWTPAR